MARADDGHTPLIARNAITVSASLYPQLKYNLRRDLKAVSQVTAMPHVVVVTPTLPVKNLQDFIGLAKSRLNQLNFSSAGIGNADDMAAELFATMANLQMMHVPYTGGSQALTAAAAGDAAVLPRAAGQPSAGEGAGCAPLAVTSKTRSTASPDVPTMEEAGLPGYQTVLWYGVYAPGVHARRDRQAYFGRHPESTAHAGREGKAGRRGHRRGGQHAGAVPGLHQRGNRSLGHHCARAQSEGGLTGGNRARRRRGAAARHRGVVCDRFYVGEHGLHSAKHSYIDALISVADVAPMLIPAAEQLADMAPYLEAVSGLLFPGRGVERRTCSGMVRMRGPICCWIVTATMSPSN